MSDTSEPRKPTHRLKVKRREGAGHTAEVGIGWQNADTGAIRIALYPGTCLDWKSCDELLITLFPADRP